MQGFLNGLRKKSLKLALELVRQADFTRLSPDGAHGAGSSIEAIIA